MLGSAADGPASATRVQESGRGRGLARRSETTGMNDRRTRPPETRTAISRHDLRPRRETRKMPRRRRRSGRREAVPITGIRIMRSIQRLLLAILFVGALAAPASAQVYITPTVGGYVPASDFQTLRGEARDARIERSATMALGMNLELGALRGSLAYVTGTELTEDGVADRGAIGDGSMLAGSLGLVVRPIPRILGLQPYWEARASSVTVTRTTTTASASGSRRTRPTSRCTLASAPTSCSADSASWPSSPTSSPATTAGARTTASRPSA